MSVNLTSKQLIHLWREGSLKLEGKPEYVVVEEGEWDGADEKYQSLDVIFTDGERNYRGYITRSGSYFSDWEYVDYGNADIETVEKRTRTVEITEWEAV